MREAIATLGAQLVYLPPYSPDVSPFEMAGAKLKALLRQDPARTVEPIWRCIATVLDAFPAAGWANHFQAAGHRHSI